LKIITGKKCQYKIDNFQEIKNKMLNWANRFGIFCFLDNHQYEIQPHDTECMLAAGCQQLFMGDDNNGLKELQHFINGQKGWLFGHFNYDLKNEIENLSSNYPDHVAFPDIFFFKPEILLRLNDTVLEIEAEEPAKVYNEILNVPVKEISQKNILLFQSRLTKQEYLQIINQLKAHILRGDCYEINYCIEFFSEHAVTDPAGLYQILSALSPNPFSAYYRIHDKYLICASPERFIKKMGDRILSQPIKGTSARMPGNKEFDDASRQKLKRSEKDRSENVMVVDLVRNDLSKICIEGSVSATELFGVYSFPQVHQMISTVEGKLKPDQLFTDIIRATFPMGSMTGAPKKRVMELIEKYEKSRRGIFSGAIGYLSPAGDFDFNVVIRSIMINTSKKYLSYQVGSAITYLSDPEEEWEECLLKAEAIKKVLY
jgi:para-aminobenzoate synthetase component 1